MVILGGVYCDFTDYSALTTCDLIYLILLYIYYMYVYI